MKNKRINRILATTLMTVMLVTPIMSTAYAMEAAEPTFIESSNEFELNSIDDMDDNMEVGDEIVFSDYEIYKAAKDAGYDVDMSIVNQNRVKRGVNGVNKVVKTKTGYSIYVTKNTLILIKTAGIAAVSGLLAPLAPAVVGVVSNTLIAAASMTTSSGKVFRFDKIKIGKYDYKYAFIKKWNQ